VAQGRVLPWNRLSKRVDVFSMIYNQQDEAGRSLTRPWEGPKVYGIHKPKSLKVRPVDSSDSTELSPGGMLHWKRTIEAQDALPAIPDEKFPQWLLPKFSHDLARGTRLTAARLAALRIGPDVTE
jgi:hypothetical protein